MERGGFRHYRKHSNSSPAIAGMGGIMPNAHISNLNSGNQGSAAESPPCLVREQDHHIPIANVVRIMRRILPAHAKISDDAKEAIQECVSEYISFITGEANERCQLEKRKTLTAEDLLWAMGKLGFDNYIGPLSLYLCRYRAVENGIRTSMRGEPLLRRANSLDYGSIGLSAYEPSFPMDHQSHHLGFFDQIDGTANGYHKNLFGASGSDSRAAFDPNTRYK